MSSQPLATLSSEELEKRIGANQGQITDCLHRLEAMLRSLPNPGPAEEEVHKLRELFTGLWMLYLAARKHPHTPE